MSLLLFVTVESTLANEGKSKRVRADELTELVQQIDALDLADIEEDKPLLLKALGLAISIKDTARILFCYDELSGMHIQYYANDTADAWSGKLLSLSQKAKDQKMEAKANYLLGLAQQDRYNADNAIMYLNKAAALDTSAYLNLAINNTLGDLYEDQDLFATALKHYFLAAKQAVIKNDSVNYAAIQCNIGIVYTELEQYEKAKSFNSNAISIADEMRDEASLIHFYGLHAELLNLQDSLSKAMVYADKAIELCKKFDFPLIGPFRSVKADILQKSGHLSEAESTIKVAIKECIAQLDDPYINGAIYQILSEIKRKQKSYKAALQHAFSSLKYRKILKQPFELKEVNKQLSDVYASMGRYDSAFYHLNAFKHINDSISIHRNVELAKVAEMDFESLLEDQQIRLLEKEQLVFKERNEIYRGVSTALFSILFFGTIGLLFVTRNQKRIALKQSELLQQNQIKDNILDILSIDLKEPATALLGVASNFNELIQNEAFTKLSKLTINLEDRTSSLIQTIENLLHWSMNERNLLNFTMEKLQLKQVLYEAIDTLEELRQAKNVQLNIDIRSSECIRVNHASILLVFKNILSYLIDHAQVDDTLLIQAGKHSNKVFLKFFNESSEVLNNRFSSEKLSSKMITHLVNDTKRIERDLSLLLAQELTEKNNGYFSIFGEENENLLIRLILPVAD